MYVSLIPRRVYARGGRSRVPASVQDRVQVALRVNTVALKKQDWNFFVIFLFFFKKNIHQPLSWRRSAAAAAAAVGTEGAASSPAAARRWPRRRQRRGRSPNLRSHKVIILYYFFRKKCFPITSRAAPSVHALVYGGHCALGIALLLLLAEQHLELRKERTSNMVLILNCARVFPWVWVLGFQLAPPHMAPFLGGREP